MQIEIEAQRGCDGSYLASLMLSVVVTGRIYLLCTVCSSRQCVPVLHHHRHHHHRQTVASAFFFFVCSAASSTSSLSMCELTPHLWCWNINAQSWLVMSFWFMGLLYALFPHNAHKVAGRQGERFVIWQTENARRQIHAYIRESMGTEGTHTHWDIRIVLQVFTSANTKKPMSNGGGIYIHLSDTQTDGWNSWPQFGVTICQVIAKVRHARHRTKRRIKQSSHAHAAYA